MLRFTFSPPLLRLLALLGLGFGLAGPLAAFEFVIVGDDLFSESQQAAFVEAKQVWTDVITGYAPGITQTALTVNVAPDDIDGVGGIIGLATVTSSTIEGGFTISTEGSFTLDAADLTNLENAGFLVTAIAHEFGHIIGIGTQWVANGAYVKKSGQYQGTHGLAAYRREFDEEALFVPVELSGGAGSDDSHWQERNDIVDDQGNPFANDLMTGFLSPENYLTWTTIYSLRDIGYEVILYPPDPLVGDFNGDLIVDGLDFVFWRDALGSDLAAADGDGDGFVDEDDYEIWKNAFGSTPPELLPALNVVPEPVSPWSACLAIVVLMSRCRNGEPAC